jgi:DNA-binding transcriptional ArsR family regulator
MKQNSREKILDFISKNKDKQYTIKDFVEYCGVSRQAISSALKSLEEDGLIIKYGRSPKVFFQYFEKYQKERWNEFDVKNLTESQEKDIEILLSEMFNVISETYYNISPIGQKEIGVKSFLDFCKKNKRLVIKTATEYVETVEKYKVFKENGFVNAKQKIEDSLNIRDLEMYVDEAYYLDFYSYPVFGKTKLGSQVFYSKNSQDEKFMIETFSAIKDKILTFVKNKKIKAIAYIPPSIKRETQFMSVLRDYLKIELPEVKLVKVRNEVVVQQKSIKKLSDRIENAKHTIFIDKSDGLKFENILLIDDAVGSGATFNEVAKKIKDNEVAKKVFAIALVGSANGFDVVGEV